ncbi:nucleotidyltransferase domain-containing protein [Candidatus Woesearchaeota archaeon]|nr:nucleotidyltransferase domain-containing protein [Candidatus Woesearchaeota archaeon]
MGTIGSHMPPLATKEREVLLLLFKDFSKDYNANSVSKKLQMSRRGALKIVKKLEKQGLLLGRQYGKAVFYKINLNEIYARKMIEILLMEESKEKAARWLFEFKELFPQLQIIILFGSTVRDYDKAHDIDLLLVFTKTKFKTILEWITMKNRILLKPIHPINQTSQDLITNLKKPDPVVLNALRFGYVLYGYEKLIKAVYQAQQAYGNFAVPEPKSRL